MDRPDTVGSADEVSSPDFSSLLEAVDVFEDLEVERLRGFDVKAELDTRERLVRKLSVRLTSSNRILLSLSEVRSRGGIIRSK